MTLAVVSNARRALADAPCPLPRIAHLGTDEHGPVVVVVTDAFCRPGQGVVARLGADGRVGSTLASARLRLDAVRYHLPHRPLPRES
ncbi:MAG: hypothetical protein M0004_14645 [Actinomycetota bacterium]|nr:hypothetical protein [Actinomycetota bacterium]